MLAFDWSVLRPQDEETTQNFLNQSFAQAQQKPEFVGDVVISNLSFGDTPPTVQVLDITAVSEATAHALGVPPAGSGVGDDMAALRRRNEEMEIHVRIDYSGNASFRIDTALVLNFPSPGFAKLPITLWVRKCEFSGVAMVIQADGKISLSFADDGSVGPLKDVLIESELGDVSKPRLTEARQIERFIITQLQTAMRTRLVFPNMLSVPLKSSQAAGGDGSKANKSKLKSSNKPKRESESKRKRRPKASTNTSTGASASAIEVNENRDVASGMEIDDDGVADGGSLSVERSSRSSSGLRRRRKTPSSSDGGKSRTRSGGRSSSSSRSHSRSGKAAARAASKAKGNSKGKSSKKEMDRLPDASPLSVLQLTPSHADDDTRPRRLDFDDENS